MKRTSPLLLSAVLLTAVVVVKSGRSAESVEVYEKATGPATLRAVSPDPAIASAAIAELRADGPEGLEALRQDHANELRSSLTISPSERAKQPTWQRLSAALDGVGAQRDNWASNLYWYTDWEQAKRAATLSRKPILSLRLLGSLQDELSCANSRFFRTALYPNPDIGSFLRKNFVLHWQAVRPAPKVTVDFGDGRKLQTTITGNSIHYVTTPSGEIVDALPGLYSGQAFRRWLNETSAVVKSADTQTEVERKRSFAGYHRRRANEIAAAWQHDLGRIGLSLWGSRARLATDASVQSSNLPPAQQQVAFEQSVVPNRPVGEANAERTTLIPGGGLVAPTARRAAAVAMTKRVMEIVPAITVEVPRDRTGLETATDAEAWQKLANLYTKEAKLTPASLAVMRAKAANEATLATVVKTFEQSIAIDTVRNEYLLHGKLHDWLAAAPNLRDINGFNRRVYNELFLTPDSDPWLGLLPAEAYNGVANGGVVTQ